MFSSSIGQHIWSISNSFITPANFIPGARNNTDSLSVEVSSQHFLGGSQGTENSVQLLQADFLFPQLNARLGLNIFHFGTSGFDPGRYVRSTRFRPFYVMDKVLGKSTFSMVVEPQFVTRNHDSSFLPSNPYETSRFEYDLGGALWWLHGKFKMGIGGRDLVQGEFEQEVSYGKYLKGPEYYGLLAYRFMLGNATQLDVQYYRSYMRTYDWSGNGRINLEARIKDRILVGVGSRKSNHGVYTVGYTFAFWELRYGYYAFIVDGNTTGNYSGHLFSVRFFQKQLSRL